MINFPTVVLSIGEEAILGAGGASSKDLHTTYLENNPELVINTSGTTGVVTASFDMGLGFVNPVDIASDDSLVLYKPGLQRIKLVGSVAEITVLITAQKGESTNALLEQKADLVAGKVPADQLPSYVDDVVEVANYAALPVSGETGKIYITVDTGFSYRWSGSAYVQIGGGSSNSFPGESGVTFDVTLGEVAANNLFGSVINPLLLNKPTSLITNLLARFVAGTTQGLATGTIVDSTVTTNIQNYFGIIRDTGGVPSHAADWILEIMNGTDSVASLNMESGGLQHQPLYFSDVAGGQVTGSLTADTFRLAANAILGASGSNIVPGFASGSNSNGYWMKLYDSAGATVACLQLARNVVTTGLVGQTNDWPVAFPDEYWGAASSVHDKRIGEIAPPANATQYTLYSYTVAGAGSETYMSIIGFWVKA